MNKITKKIDKLQVLLRDGRELYHTQDLGVLWGIDEPNTLYTAIKRHVKRGTLSRVQKGLYSTVAVDKIDPFVLGLTALHRYGYVSCESILAKEGVIFQDVKYITLVSDVHKKMEIGGHKFLVRQMRPQFLYNSAGIIMNKDWRTASLERAVADMLYFNPAYHFDAESMIDRQKVKNIQKEIGY